jgi:hypothetical protein
VTYAQPVLRTHAGGDGFRGLVCDIADSFRAREDWAAACSDGQRFRSGLSTVFLVAGTISTSRRRGGKPLCTYRNREADDVSPDHLQSGLVDPCLPCWPASHR